ncbi:hypothetical protein H4R33_005572 [Dimargaris cristalligena]|nr:hypothetical protein H4R33_005572 [Dimargaris cristalligena]
MKLRLGVVPEHFSSPVFLYERDGRFQALGLDIEVVICEAGTGDMLKRLRQGTLDLAFCVTEGLTTAIANETAADLDTRAESPVRMVGTYVESPLCWAVSTGYNARPTEIADLQGGTMGISRYGSGSHIMSLYMADKYGWSQGGDGKGNASGLQFQVLHNLPGLTEGAVTGQIDAFLWELFTTKNLYDQKVLKHIGNVIPPWSSFTIAARVHRVLDSTEGRATVQRFLAVLNQAVADFLTGMRSPTVESSEETADSLPRSLAFLMERFRYSEKDAQDWFKTVRYPADVRQVAREEIRNCIAILTGAGAIHTEAKDPSEIISKDVAQLV